MTRNENGMKRSSKASRQVGKAVAAQYRAEQAGDTKKAARHDADAERKISYMFRSLDRNRAARNRQDQG